MKHLQKTLALVWALILLFSLAAPAALAAESTVTIRTVEDLAALSKHCTLDTWSRGKTVLLAQDLDLSGTDFTPIPTFGGSFQGQGHTISGLKLTGSGNVRGLFRYLQSGATVQDLTVKGTIHPSERQDDLGLLAGSNAGRILNCSAEGSVMGDNRIGGLVGTNASSGELVGCRFSGSVTGKHSAGGVVGENHGTLTLCENSGSINTKDLEDNPKTDYSNLEQLNSTENIPVYTDIGGVAGLSSGTLQSCSNSGAVGYDQIGCNIGGVAGRSSGWLDGCSNTGAVAGRKDVGGIVGQLEPEVVQAFSSDFLDRLLDQLDALQDTMDRTVNHADHISDAVHTQLDDLSGKARTVKTIAGDLTDAMTDWANGNIDQINELSARVSWSLKQLDGILADAEDLVDALDDLLDEVERVRKILVTAAGEGAQAAADLQAAAEALQQANQKLQDALPAITDAMDKVVEALQSGRMDDLIDALGQLSDALKGLDGVMEDLDTALAALKESLKNLGDMGADIKLALERLEYVNKAAQKVLDELSTVTEGLRNLVDELSKKPDIKIDPIGTDITDQSDQLNAAMDALLDSGDALNQLLGDSADTLIGDLKAINTQFRAITNLIRSEKANWDTDQGDNLEDRIHSHFEDDSQRCDPVRQHDGRVSTSENRGTVSGDSQVGGIIGSIGIETDFDVDSDVNRVGAYSLDFHYQARALASSCINNGSVTGRNDGVGGIVGQVYLGLVSGCESYSPVTTDGSYVGGIAGRAEGTLVRSWSKCSVSGKDYVGGIAGYAQTLTDCRALASVSGSAYVGAVAGGVSDDAQISGNQFTHETLGGIDGISYAGKTDPVSFDALCTADDVPLAFTQLELTFRADGAVIAVVPFRYGSGIDTLPDIPAKKGCSAAWPDLDYTHLTASQTLDAIYTPYQSALADGSDELPQLLVDGSFSHSAAVSHTTQSVSWTDAKGTAHTGDAVTVTVDDPDLKEISYTVHYRLPDSSKRYALWVETEEGWTQQDSRVDGSYLLFTSTQPSVTFCLQEQASNSVLRIVLAAAAIILVIVVVVLAVRKRRSRTNGRLQRLKKAARQRTAKK